MKSVLNKQWNLKKFDERLSRSIKQIHDISESLSNLLSIRGIKPDQVSEFFNPKIKNILPDPFLLQDMNKAVDHVINAIENNKKITIFADYDVDGATSASILKRFFNNIGYELDIYIPDRILEGYGPNTEALLNLKNSGVDLVITVDCGTVSFKPLEEAKKAGLEIIVIDHHLGVVEKPDAIAIINPNLLEETFEHKNLCAAGVVFLFVVAINKKLRERNFYTNKKEPNLIELLDLVALGTVCDVMPLTGLNRAFVTLGLKILKQRKNLGLKQISDLVAFNSEPNVYSLGFIFGPRINAGGRVGKSNLGARILSSEDEFEVKEIATQLEMFNQQRKDIEAQVLDEAVSQLEKNNNNFSTKDPIIFVQSNNWHQGVIGIVASRLKDLYNKPVAVISIDDKTNKGKASCRSINGIDFGAEILKARLQGLLIEGGGHAMAGGFSVKANKIAELHNFFCKNLKNKVDEILSNNINEFEVELDLAQLNIDLLKEFSKLEPFGVGNAKPKFCLRNVQKITANLVGKNHEHINCIFSTKTLLGFSQQIQGTAFRAKETKIGEILLSSSINKKMHLIGTVNINNWMGSEKMQIIIDDIILI